MPGCLSLFKSYYSFVSYETESREASNSNIIYGGEHAHTKMEKEEHTLYGKMFVTVSLFGFYFIFFFIFVFLLLLFCFCFCFFHFNIISISQGTGEIFLLMEWVGYYREGDAERRVERG